MKKLLLLLLSLSGCTSVSIKEATWKDPDGFAVFVTEYSGAQQKGTVIILPPTGGVTSLEKRYASKLVDRGQRVILVKDWTDLDSDAVDLDVHNRLYSHANRAVGMVLKHSDGEVGILGTSLGALYSFSALLRYPMINRAVLIVGGYPFTNVITSSDYPTMKALREKRYAKYGYQNESIYRDELTKIFNWNDVESLRSDRVQKVSILLFQGTADVAVPTATQVELAKQLPNAKVVKLDNGHLWTIIKTYLFHSDEVIEQLVR